MHYKTLNSLVLMSALLFITGCVATKDSPYCDPGEPRGRGTNFTSYDIQQCAITMIDSMLTNPKLDKCLKEQFQFATNRPIVLITPIRNETYQLGLRLDSITEKIKTRLVNSGKFDFLDRSTEQLMIDELLHDKNSPLTIENEVDGFKSQMSAQYLLTGRLIEIRDVDGRKHDAYYQLILQLLNKRTGKIDWSSEKELRKVSTRPLVGW